MEQLEVVGIQKSFRKKRVLEQASFVAGPGECVGILGSNGSGKSTLLGILAGVLRADAGKALWQGTDLLREERLRSRLVAYVPQGTPLMEELTARDNLLLWYDKSTMERELEDGMLAMLGIPDFLRTPVAKMSGGMKKRLSIGCAISGHPRILLLDEPSAALDLPCKERILNYFLQVKKQGGILVISTHDVQELAACDRWYLLKDGCLSPYDYDGNVHRLVGRL